MKEGDLVYIKKSSHYYYQQQFLEKEKIPGLIYCIYSNGNKLSHSYQVTWGNGYSNVYGEIDLELVQTENNLIYEIY